jgi:predicted aspartyl protease
MPVNWLGPVSATMLAVVSLPLSNQASSDDAPRPVDLIELQRDHYNRMTVPVTIDKHGPFKFMIDTGAQATVLSRDLADRLALSDRDSATLVAMASTRTIETAFVPNLRLGSRQFDIQTAPLVDRANIGSADGVLGLDSLQDQRVLLDFDKHKIAVADAKELGGNKGYEIVIRARRKLGQLIVTNARFDGVSVAVILDTGAQASIGNVELMRRLRSRATGPVQLTDINGVQVDGHVRIAKNIHIGRAKFSNVPMTFVDSPIFKQLGFGNKPAMVLGMNELRLFRRVAIDFKQRKVLFDLPKNAAW